MSKWNAETAEWYAKKYGDYATNRLAVQELDITNGAHVVDIGCGTGEGLRHAALQVTEGIFVGIDPVDRMIEIAQEWTAGHPTSDRIEYRAGNAESIPVDTNFADYVFAFDSIDHWQDIDAGLDEVLRILKPGGIFVIVKDHGVPEANAALRRLAEKLIKSGFAFEDDKEINAEGISFSLWLCTPNP